MTDKKDEKTKDFRVPIKVIFIPRAGKPKTMKTDVGNDGIVRIRGGAYNVSNQAQFPYKGRLPWVIIRQDTMQAINTQGTPDILSPQFFNEAISNHYASDVGKALEEFGREKKADYIAYGMLALMFVTTLIFGIWTISTLGGIHDAINTLVTQLATQAASGAPPAGSETTVVHA